MISLRSVVFPAPFGPITPTMPPGGSDKIKILEQHAVAVRLAHAFGFNHHIAQARAVGDKDLQIVAVLFMFLAEQFFIGIDARFAFGLPRLLRHVNPFKFAFQRLLPLGFGLLFQRQPLLLLLQPR